MAIPITGARSIAGDPDQPLSEGSRRGSVVALVTPFVAMAASWLAGVVGKLVPGVELDPAQITAMMVAVVGAVLTVAWKWLQGWQRHEQNVCEGKATPVKHPKQPK
jgi:hypothetical protein